MAVKMSDLKADPKLLVAALAHGKKSHTSENILFFHDKGNAEGVYPKYISPKSATQVNIAGKLQTAMDGLAAKGDWNNPAWPTLIQGAKEEVEAMWNIDVAKKFEASDEYKNYVAAKAPKKIADPAKAAKLLGIKNVAKLKKAMEMGIAGKRADAVKLLGELAKEEKLKEKDEAIMKALEKAGLV